MTQAEWAGELESSRTFFLNTIACLQAKDGDFRPTPEAFSVTEQIAHTAHTVDWFCNGITSEDGFLLDFEAHEKEFRSVKSLPEAKAWFEKAMNNAIALIAERDMEFWNSRLPDGPILPHHPRRTIIGGISDHTAHHRGALTVYARLIGYVPAMPYG